ncbi:conserved hypothetical protein [Pediculus humanus corporis]|uniref:Serine/threonine-protein phosphatase 6 regulatory subunit n=1 Tax=Pediculus humanus subsp. corporis TaxID=121224 RepID=E0VZN9_PEDHC|nr:uncharacterized protein Phum_PHUM537070 [Pediculus humanus corporis]EEB18845.1 conserved hypothetical protein [Pediculus humanus corporis]
MYWNSTHATSVNFEVLLSKENVTLQEIMDDDGVLEECRTQNKRLIEYLIQSDVLEKLVKLTIEEPSGNEDDAIKYKYSNIACELLTCEVPPLSETLANDKALLGKLYSFLDTDAPLNPLLASFFSKTLSVLITRNSERVLEFLKLKEDSISLLLKHLGTSAIMDLILNLITKVEGADLRELVLNWLDEQKLVQRLVALLDPSVDPDRHCNAAQLLCDLINILRSNKMEVLHQNKILDRIESPETVTLLLDHILKEPKCETSIVGGISVLLVLLENKWHSDGRIVFDENTQAYVDFLAVVASTVKAILPRLKDFHNILVNPPLKPTVKTTIAMLEPPLGNVRVEIAKLLSVLVAHDDLEVNKELEELDTINVLLDLFFKYTWNNFLHTQVQKCLIHAFNLYPTSDSGEFQRHGLVPHILSKCHIIQRILDAWQDNETQQTEYKRPRRGYMGHLIEIANKICMRAQTHSFGALMKETVDNETLNKWENFVNTKFYEIQETYMGGNYPLPEKDGGVGKNGSFGDFSQVLYSNYYQLQNLAASVTGQFGSFQEDQFNDDEDALNFSKNPNFEKINFNLPEGETDRQAVFFEKVCAQKFQTLDDYNGDYQPQENSSSDEEDEDNLERNKNFLKDDQQHSNVDKMHPWAGDGEGMSGGGGVPPAETMNPWESSNMTSVASPDLGWANFDSAPFVVNFGLNFPSTDINTTIATSASYDMDTMPLDLTPSENNGNIDDIFLNKGLTDPPSETPEIIENNPVTVEYTNLEVITKTMGAVSLNDEKDERVARENNEDGSREKKESSGVEEKGKENPTGKLDKTDDKQKGANCVENPASVIGDVNNKVVNEESDSRFLSSKGLTTSNDKEPEGGDYYQLAKENVQTVPNETTKTSSEIGSSNNKNSNNNNNNNNNNTEDKSANGPI